MTLAEGRGGQDGKIHSNSGPNGSNGVVMAGFTTCSDINPVRPALITRYKTVTNTLEWSVPANFNGSQLHFEIELKRVISEPP